VRSLGVRAVFALATVACGANAGGTTDLSGGVSQDRADEAMTALCDIAEGRVVAFEEVEAAFNDRAHETLHHIASAAREEDASEAAALLEAKSVVEADLEQDEAPAGLARHVAALAAATATAIRAIGLEGEPCSA
jgi:hypothetical protein